MSDTLSAGSSLIFYTGKNYAGNAQQITHGVTGELAGSSATWDYQSVALSAMDAYVFSVVNTADTTMNYLGHVEAVISVSQADLTLLYPSSDQFPLNYLGLDPAQAAVVWLDVDAIQAAPNAVASTALVGGGSSSITTLSLPGRPGALGFVAKTEGSSVAASCRYGDYNTANGTVTWSGTGTLVLEYTGGIVTLINGGGFPAGWTFSAPKLQGDGSWAVALNGGVPATDTISSVTANPGSIVDDGVSSSVITATVLNGSGQPASGVTVTWSTSLGAVAPASSVTDTNGLATTTLTDNGAPGTATVTASITGSSKSISVTVNTDVSGLTLYSDVNWAGSSAVLAEHDSTVLRDPLYAWNWESVKSGGEHLMARTLFTDSTAFDFRTYMDTYSATDVTDLTVDYPLLLTAPLVQGTVLGENDVIVRVLLLPTDSSQKVVACATQSWPQIMQTASVTNGATSVEGILVVMNKISGTTVVPLQVGRMDDSGVIDWLYTTTLVASWDESNQLPVIVLGRDAPEGWLLLPCQPTARAGEFKTALSGIVLTRIYYVTDAPAKNKLNTDETYTSTNKIIIYGSGGDIVTCTLSGGAIFMDNNANSITITLGSSTPYSLNVVDQVVETVNVVTTINGVNMPAGTLNFTDFIFQGNLRLAANNGAPSDGVSVNSVYFDTKEITPNTVNVTLGGSAVFLNTTLQSKSFSLSVPPQDLTFDITDTVSESITVTCTVLNQEPIYCLSTFS